MPGLQTGVVGVWTLTTNANDDSGNGFNFSAIGSITYGADGATSDGTAYLSQVHNAAFDAGITTSWFATLKFKRGGSAAGVFLANSQNDNDPYYDAYVMGMDGFGRFRAYNYNDAAFTTVPGAGVTHTGFAWYDHTTGTLYAQLNDGTVASAITGAIPGFNTEPFTLFATNEGNSNFAGSIKDVGLWVVSDVTDLVAACEWFRTTWDGTFAGLAAYGAAVSTANPHARLGLGLGLKL